MKKLLKRFISFCLWLVLALVIHILGTVIWGVDATNTVTYPDWYTFAVILLPIVIICVLHKFLKPRVDLKRTTKVTSNAEFKIPFSRSKQTELAEDILANIKVCVSLANGSSIVSSFVEYYDEALDGFAKLKQLAKVDFQGSPAYDFYSLKDEFQWHLCDAIERAKDKAISEIKDKYRNSREFQERTLRWFKNDVDSVRNRFSESTTEFADKAIAEVEQLVTPKATHEPRNKDISRQNRLTSNLLAVDSMEGHEFEYWCAALLEKNGFIDVVVTPGSGDHGVDITAAKDSVHYAIQCKCYSSDLGNKPVQEVYAGKEMYKCQVAAVMTNRYFTIGAKQLAEETRVLLWDRDKLEEMSKV